MNGVVPSIGGFRVERVAGLTPARMNSGEAPWYSASTNLGLFDRMPLLIADFCTVAKGNWKDADRKQLLRIRNFFLGICREVPSVRRTSFP